MNTSTYMIDYPKEGHIHGYMSLLNFVK